MGAMRSSLAARVRTFLDVFGRRGDVLVLEHEVLPGVGVERARDLREEWGDAAMEHLAPFAEEIAGLTFTWALASRAGELTGRSPGSSGGRLAIRSARDLRMRRNDGGMPEHVLAFIPIDVFVAEGRGGLARDRGEDAAWRMVFEDASRNRIVEMESWASYLTRGARRAFTWYWQVDDPLGAEILLALRARSMPAHTPRAVLLARLRDAGVGDGLASELLEWLGDDAVLLFTR
jgi:hypothetical protein